MHREKLFFALFHCRAVRVSFQMEAPVDKQVYEVFSRRMAIKRCFARGDAWTEDDLPLMSAHFIGKNVGGVGFSCKLRIKFARFAFRYEGNRDVPCGKHIRGDCEKSRARHLFLRAVMNGDRGH